MKKRILAMFLVITLIAGTLPANVFATEEAESAAVLCETEGCEFALDHEGNCSNYQEPAMMTGVAPVSVEDGVIYKHGTDGSNWPMNAAYVNTVKLTGAGLVSYTWNADTCEVVLAADTAADADITFTIALTGQPQFVNTSVVQIDGVQQPARKGTVKLVNGEKTVPINVNVRGSAVTKTFILRVAGGGVKNDPPVLKEGISATVSAVAYTGCGYGVNLADIFEDPDGNDLTYTVKIGNAAAELADVNYVYTPNEAGSRKLVFTANDGKADSPAYTVELTVLPSDLTLDQDAAELKIGQTLTLTATVSPETAAVSWSSSDDSVATVAGGVVTPVKEGTAVITASAAGKTAACTVTVIDPSVLRAKVTVSGSRGGTLVLANASVVVKDLNGDNLLSYDEALIAAHEAYWPGGYETDWGSYGIQVGKLWGEGDGYFANALFYTNDQALQMNVGESYVQEGDRLYACSLKYPYSWNDAYTYFDRHSLTVYTGEEFTLTLKGGSYMGSALVAEGLTVGIWSDGSSTPLAGKSFDSANQVTLSFAQAGTYVVTAEGEFLDDYGMDAPIMPPVCVVTVREATAERVELSQTALTMTINTTQKLTATVHPANAVDKTLTWTSSDASVVSVDKNGNLTARKAGSATITATTANGKKATCQVAVELAEPAADAKVTVTISKRGVLALVDAAVIVKDLNSDGKLTYDEALTAAHDACFEGENGFAINQNSGWVYRLWGEETSNLLFFKNDAPLAEFTNSNSSVVREGDSLYAAILMYETAYKDLYTRFDQKAAEVKAGQELELVLTGYLGAHNGRNPSWNAVAGATVGIWQGGTFTATEGKTTDAEGKVKLTFDQAGTYIVSAYNNAASAPLMAPVCVVTVTSNEAQSVTLDPAELSLKEGESGTITATVLPENAADQSVTWSSSDEAVATVDANGKVTAVAAGTATITATTANNKTATCVVSVEEAVLTNALSALKFSAGSAATSTVYEMIPAFNPAIRSYTVVVPDASSAFFIWAKLDANTTGTMKANYKNTSGASKSVTVTSGKTSGTSMSGTVGSGKLTGNTVTVTIGGNTAYTITVVRQATLSELSLKTENADVAISPKFDKAKYEYTARVPADAVLSVMAKAKVSGATVTVNGSSETVVTPDWNERNAAVVVRVTADGAVAAEYTVRLTECATALEILTPPTKTEYAAGEKFDPTGMTLQATYRDGSAETIGPDRYIYAPDDALIPGAASVSVSFDGMTVEQTITVPAAFEGDGTQEVPYLIKMAEDLVTLSNLVGDGLSFSGQYFKMVNDITLPADWIPLGISAVKSFGGNFDGGNNLLTVPEGGLPLIGVPVGATLQNLNVYGKQIAGCGVVNQYSQGATIVIDNVTLKSGTQTLKSGFIGGYASGQDQLLIRNSTIEKDVVIGYDKQQSNIGSFAGEYNGIIENCVSYADVYGVNFAGGIVANKGQTMGDFIVKNSAFHGTVTASGNYVGGIVGHGYAGTGWGIASAPNAPIVTIQNCVCSGTVQGENYVGGILGAESGVAQCWDNGIGYIQNNSFTGKLICSGSYAGGVIGYIRSLNKYTVITGNYYTGADRGIGGVEYVDTNCETHETESGATYLNTENGTSGCPSIQYCNWKKAHNRTDDPLGADATNLCYTDTQSAPVPVELMVSGSYKTSYHVGEELDLSGMVLTLVYNDASTGNVELKDATVSGYDPNKIGSQSISISYDSLVAFITVTVQNKKSEMQVTVTVLGDGVHDSDADGKIHSLAAGNLTTWVNAAKVTVEGNATAWDAIQEVMDAHGLSITYSYNSTYGSYYIESVNGLAEFTNGRNSGWMYTVNGVHQNVGVSACYLRDGDTIVLHYTDNYFYEDGKTEDKDQTAAKTVEDLINGIVENAVSFEADVKAAKRAYDQLTADQKKLVGNYDKLAKYLKTLEDGESESADTTFADIEKAYKTTGNYLENLGTPVPGSIGGEWMVIGLIRSGRGIKNMDAYYEAAVRYVQENIDENGRLHHAKSTENARMILALTALGKDVTDVGGHNLLEGLNSMSYVQKQGINGPIWALIALDSGNYPVPQGDVSRAGLIKLILDAQMADGGWALGGNSSDPDMTGMALQALAPYNKTDAAVKTAIDKAIAVLSEMQADDGSFGSIDGKSSESIAQVVTGLSALGIDPHTDERFIKNGVSAMDALGAFFVEGGGFKHILTGKLDGMATEQSYYALTAYFRMLEGKHALYNMTDVIDRGGDMAEEIPIGTLPVETQPVETAPADTDHAGGGFPVWPVGGVLAAGAVIMAVLKRRKIFGNKKA